MKLHGTRHPYSFDKPKEHSAWVLLVCWAGFHQRRFKKLKICQGLTAIRVGLNAWIYGSSKPASVYSNIMASRPEHSRTLMALNTTNKLPPLT